MSYILVDEQEADRDLPGLSIMSLWFGVVLIGLTAVAHISRHSIHQSWAFPLTTGMEFILFAFILSSIIYLAYRVKQGVKLAAIPLAINIGTLIIIRLVPFSQVWEDVRFEWQAQSFERVANLVVAGELVPDANNVVTLPFRYRSLTSEKGQIWATKEDGVTIIFFPIDIGDPQSFAGYIYRSDNLPPQGDEFGGQWRFVTQKRPFWFFCASYATPLQN